MNMHVKHPDEVLAPEKGGADHRFDKFRFSRALEFLRPVMSGNLTWLDLGCHQGEFLRFIESPYFILHGCDKWTERLPGPWAYYQIDLEKNFPSVSANVISCFEMIEHVTDTDFLLQEIHAHLHPCGWVILSTPNINSLRNRVLIPLGIYPTGLEYRNVIHHVRLYNPAALVSQLREAGFVNVRVRGVSFLPLHSRWGTGHLSQWLANLFPSLCNNFMVIAQKGPSRG